MSSVIENYNLSHHIYTDSKWIYFSFSATNVDVPVSNLKYCLCYLCDWLNCNRLKINPGKTKVVLFNPSRYVPPSLRIDFTGQALSTSSAVKHFGVIHELIHVIHALETLSFDQHVIAICQSSFIFARYFCSIYCTIDNKCFCLFTPSLL